MTSSQNNKFSVDKEVFECTRCGTCCTWPGFVKLSDSEIDEIAFVRYASVYRRFQDLEEFEKEIESLREASKTEVKGTQFSIFPEEEE